MNVSEEWWTNLANQVVSTTDVAPECKQLLLGEQEEGRTDPEFTSKEAYNSDTIDRWMEYLNWTFPERKTRTVNSFFATLLSEGRSVENIALDMRAHKDSKYLIPVNLRPAYWHWVLVEVDLQEGTIDVFDTACSTASQRALETVLVRLQAFLRAGLVANPVVRPPQPTPQQLPRTTDCGPLVCIFAFLRMFNCPLFAVDPKDKTALQNIKHNMGVRVRKFEGARAAMEKKSTDEEAAERTLPGSAERKAPSPEGKKSPRRSPKEKKTTSPRAPREGKTPCPSATLTPEEEAKLSRALAANETFFNERVTPDRLGMVAVPWPAPTDILGGKPFESDTVYVFASMFAQKSDVHMVIHDRHANPNCQPWRKNERTLVFTQQAEGKKVWWGLVHVNWDTGYIDVFDKKNETGVLTGPLVTGLIRSERGRVWNPNLRESALLRTKGKDSGPVVCVMAKLLSAGCAPSALATLNPESCRRRLCYDLLNAAAFVPARAQGG